MLHICWTHPTAPPGRESAEKLVQGVILFWLIFGFIQNLLKPQIDLSGFLFCIYVFGWYLPGRWLGLALKPEAQTKSIIEGFIEAIDQNEMVLTLHTGGCTATTVSLLMTKSLDEEEIEDRIIR